MRILIVDDDIDFAESIAEILEEVGYEVEMAHSGEEALKKIKEQDFDLTFMDVKMPGMNGVECFLEARKMKPDAKFVMMSAYSVEELLKRAIQEGALGVLHKPFDIERMLAILKENQRMPVVLVADDDPDFVSSIQDILTKNGYSTRVAYTGQETVDTVLNNDIDVLLLDIRMPILNGLEVYRELEKHGRKVPTIVITGYAFEAHRAGQVVEIYRVHKRVIYSYRRFKTWVISIMF